MGNAKLSQVPNCPRTMKNTLYECWKIYLANLNIWTNWCIRWPHIADLLIWAKYDDSSLRALSEIDEIDEIGEIDGLPSRGEMWKWLLWRYFWLGRSPMAAPLKKCDDSEGSEWVWSPNNDDTPICASVTPNTSIPSNFMKLSPCDIIRINFLSNWTVDWTEGHLLSTQLQPPQISQSVFNNSVHIKAASVWDSFYLWNLSQRMPWRSRGMRLFLRHRAATLTWRKSLATLPRVTKVKKDYPSFEIPIYDGQGAQPENRRERRPAPALWPGNP